MLIGIIEDPQPELHRPKTPQSSPKVEKTQYKESIEHTKEVFLSLSPGKVTQESKNFQNFESAIADNIYSQESEDFHKPKTPISNRKKSDSHLLESDPLPDLEMPENFPSRKLSLDDSFPLSSAYTGDCEETLRHLEFLDKVNKTSWAY